MYLVLCLLSSVLIVLDSKACVFSSGPSPDEEQPLVHEFVKLF
jgi:hypothetical protein